MAPESPLGAGERPAYTPRMPAPEMRIYLVAYDPAWPASFAAERDLLEQTIGAWIAGGIEHVGSTAIPPLPAKPVIDIMVGVRDLETSRPAVAHLQSLGYHYFPYREDVMHWLCKPSPQFRTHHLHLVPHGSPLWNERLAFRDYLRRHPDKAAEYAELKHCLAEKYEHDREAYTDAKGPFVEAVLELARAESAAKAPRRA